MSAYSQRIAQSLSISLRRVEATLELLESGATIPFIARYRKEATGELDEVQIAGHSGFGKNTRNSTNAAKQSYKASKSRANSRPSCARPSKRPLHHDRTRRPVPALPAQTQDPRHDGHRKRPGTAGETPFLPARPEGGNLGRPIPQRPGADAWTMPCKAPATSSPNGSARINRPATGCGGILKKAPSSLPGGERPSRRRQKIPRLLRVERKTGQMPFAPPAGHAPGRRRGLSARGRRARRRAGNGGPGSSIRYRTTGNPPIRCAWR